MDVQKRIRQLMAERGWSDYRLAKESNLSHSTITNIFNRNNAPTLPTLESVCSALGVTMSQFFTEGDEPVVLSSEQKIMLERFNTLSSTQRKVIIELLGNMNKGT